MRVLVVAAESRPDVRNDRIIGPTWIQKVITTIWLESPDALRSSAINGVASPERGSG
jgi:hypothetical protein